MMNDISPYLAPSVYLVAALAAGLTIETILLRRLSRITLRTNTKTDDLFVASLRGIAFTWCMMAGGFLFLKYAPVGATFRKTGSDVLFALTVISVCVLLARILVELIRTKSASASHFPATTIISNIVRIGIYIIGILIVLQTFGVSVTPILTALGVGALAVALALQDTLTNLFAGIQIIASRQIRIGDYVRLDSGDEGYVSDITWRNTIIRSLSNNNIIIPNSKIASTILTNYNRPEKEMAVLIEVGVAYDSDLDKVEEVTVAAGKEVMRNVAGAVEAFEPFIRFHTFGDSSIKFTVILRGKEFADQYFIKHQFIRVLTERYREYGIEIPFPARHLIFKHAADNEQTSPHHIQ